MNAIDYFVVSDIWLLGKCEVPYTFSELKDSNIDFMIYADLQFCIIVAICHILQNHESNKEAFKSNSATVFNGHSIPTMEQIKEIVEDESLLARIRDCNIFSFNHYKIDDSYPKRLWRLSKNCILKYDQKYWSYCYELKDCLLDFLKQNQITTQEEVNEVTASMGGQIKNGGYGPWQFSFELKNQFVKRYATNLEEFNKVFLEGPELDI